jgi:hypothetical protein
LPFLKVSANRSKGTIMRRLDLAVPSSGMIGDRFQTEIFASVFWSHQRDS